MLLRNKFKSVIRSLLKVQKQKKKFELGNHLKRCQSKNYIN